MLTEYKLKSGQINYESQRTKGAYNCIVIRDGVFHNLTEELRLDLIKKLQNTRCPNTKPVDLDSMF